MKFRVIFYFLSVLHVSNGVFLPGPCPLLNQSETALTNISHKVIGSVTHSLDYRSVLNRKGFKKLCTLKVLIQNVNCSEFYPDCPFDQGFVVISKEAVTQNFEPVFHGNLNPQQIKTSPNTYHAAIVWPCENITELYLVNIGYFVICETEECEDLMQEKSIAKTKGIVGSHASSFIFSEVVWEDEGASQQLCTNKILKIRNRWILVPIFVIIILNIFYLVWLFCPGNNRIYPMA